MANYTELNVYKATYGLLFEVLSASKSFHRDFKYTIGENLKNELINAMMQIWRANSTYTKQANILEARESVEKCRLYLRLLHDLRQINIDSFTKWNIEIQNISKQLSGWDKSEHIKANTSTNAPNM
jgi:hypothetical protein|tara:strand:- start:433 stop:810 length:378 start_codon:yes stop_codon:yes gene_type:complete